MFGQTFGTDTTRGAPNLEALKRRLIDAHKRLNGVYIENLPWQQCVERYDRDHTLFYLDPPYWKLSGYGIKFEWDEYIQMAEFMANAKGKIMLSINDHPDIRLLFSDFRIDTVAVQYSINRLKGVAKPAGELVICNW